MVFYESPHSRSSSPRTETPISGDVLIESVRRLTTEFNVSVDIDARRVTLSLGDSSLLDALNAFQLAAFNLHDRFAIRPATLRRWSNDPRFESISSPNGRVSIEIVPDSDKLSFERQDQLGLNTPTVADLALAAAAYFFVTGRQLLEEGPCRGANGILSFTGGGITEEVGDGGEELTNVFASRALSDR